MYDQFKAEKEKVLPESSKDIWSWSASVADEQS
jgi:hypothetical protein